NKLPGRAFDTEQQRAQTEQVISDYNNLLHVSPELDHKFQAIASERVRSHPVRYYIELPIVRILDMWLRPRTEMLPSDSRWWEFNDDWKWLAMAISFGIINIAYIMCAVVGWMRRRTVELIGLLVLFVVLRSVFLGTLEYPE